MPKTLPKAPPGSDITRERILKVATVECSSHGFDGARVDVIAKKSAISKNMLYYYFGKKEALYLAVLERAYERLRQEQASFYVNPEDPIESLRNLVKHTFQAMVEHPEFTRLLNDENLHEAKHIRNSVRIRRLYDPLLLTIEQILDDGVRLGCFNEHINPKILYLILSSLSYHFISNQHTLELALDVVLGSQKSRDVWLSHITEAILMYCEAGGRAGGALAGATETRRNRSRDLGADEVGRRARAPTAVDSTK